MKKLYRVPFLLLSFLLTYAACSSDDGKFVSDGSVLAPNSKVTLKYQGTSIPDTTIFIDASSKMAKPQDKGENGKAFIWWYREASMKDIYRIDFNKPITSSTLYGKYVSKDNYIFHADSRRILGMRAEKIVEIPSSIEGVPVEVLQSTADSNLFGSIIGSIIGSLFSGEPDFAFVQTVYIPNGVKRIGNDAFSECKRINQISLPNTITSIGRSAFSSTSLTSITLPSSIQEIEGGAFSGAPLVSVIVLSATPPTISNIIFNRTPIDDKTNKDAKIYVPVGSLSAYKSAENWSAYAEKIVEKQ